MVDSGSSSPTSSSLAVATSTPAATVVPSLEPTSVASHAAVDRSELLARARAFLTSPQVVHEDITAKHRFLVDKGLTSVEIDRLLAELPQPIPSIPPRTYPQLPPSRLPSLLLAVARLFTWIAGGSAALLLIYFRLVLPRLTQSYDARHKLQSHHANLLENFNTSLKLLKETQSAKYEGLPRLPPFHENAKFTDCANLEAALAVVDDHLLIPDVTLLRCGILDFQGENKRNPTTEELFTLLEAKARTIIEDESRQGSLWETLNAAPVFQQSPSTSDSPAGWTYTSPEPLSTTPLVASLGELRSSLPEPPAVGRFSHALSSLVDFTGYLTAQTYSFGAYGRSAYGGADTKLSPAAEEVRREIRALKGLVLNRRSFMNTTSAIISP